MRAVTNRTRHGEKWQEMEEYNQSKEALRTFFKSKKNHGNLITVKENRRKKIVRYYPASRNNKEAIIRGR
jgi:hypothetical protein